jgi:hypothetical protein
LRWAFDSFALYPRVIFFPLPVDGLVELLGDVEAIHYRLRVRQQRPTGVVESIGHVRPKRLHPLPLRRGQLFQAFPGRRLVAPLGNGQHRRPLRVTQVGHDRGVELVPLLQAQLVDAHVGDDPLRVDVLGLGIG